jgi:MoxR-like ATPase
MKPEQDTKRPAPITHSADYESMVSELFTEHIREDVRARIVGLRATVREPSDGPAKVGELIPSA